MCCFWAFFLTWIPFLDSLRLDPVMVVLRDDKHLALVEALVPDSCVIWIGTDWITALTRCPNFANRSVLGLWEGRSTPGLFQLFDKMGLSEVLSIGSPRKTPSRWFHASLLIKHDTCGGVTSTKHRFTWFAPMINLYLLRWNLLCLETCPQCCPFSALLRDFARLQRRKCSLRRMLATLALGTRLVITAAGSFLLMSLRKRRLLVLCSSLAPVVGVGYA
mmetsp:Transcript_23409/g.35507  ORF Transcript_23409/g.35507 Transcript_23409/m.35507 type:complete len:219 (+) Transcript_23409:2839-3495(+)